MIIDDKKQITEKKSVISACNVDYRLKRSGPIVAYILVRFLVLVTTMVTKVDHGN